MSKASLLGKWLGRKKQAAVEISVAPTTDYPVSFGQQRLWLIAQLMPENPVYHYAETYSFHGPLEPERLRDAYTEVVKRHEILRTVFYAAEGAARQRVLDEAAFDYTFVPLGEAPPSAVEVARRPFDLQRGPLSRLLLVQEQSDVFSLTVVMHHLITDKDSMRLLREELAALYRDEKPQPLPGQYGPFSLQQRARDQPGSLTYWTDQLAGAPAFLPLPADRPRPTEQRFAGRYAEGRLSADLTRRIRERCREAGVTPFVFLLSAYFVLLQRYTGREDILVGTPITNRDRQELEPLIGFFNETVVLRGRVGDTLTFGELLQRVRKTVLEAFSHKDVPFESVVRALNPERRAGANPLFQAMFILHQVPPTPRFTDEIELRQQTLDLGVTKFDLTLYIADGGEQFTTIFEYATELFSAERITRMQRHYRQLLQFVVDRTTTPLSEFNLVSERQYRALYPTAGSDREPSEGRVDEQIAHWAARTPLAVAVTYDGQSLTYADLERRAKRVVALLRERGCKEGELVALRGRRGPGMVVGLYGILRAGAAYLPIDASYPAARQEFMLRDSGARLLVDAGGEQLRVEEYRDGADPATAAEDLAYLIYTSGSSGRPKGVPVDHANLSASTAARRKVYDEAPTAFLLLSAFSFDSSVAGIFWTLTGGGKLVLPVERAEQDMEGLARLIEREAVSHTLLLPTLYRQLLEFAPPESLRVLRTVIVAGESCTPATVEIHFARLPETTLYNEYGPTEATVWSTVHRLEAADAGGPVPIGRPVLGYAIYPVDAQDRLLPAGIPGELCIGGVGLTRGYWRRPELTRERFGYLRTPTGKSVRVYRTGDRGYYRDDGTLMFLGRQDQQVKIRGHRVELGEIRTALLADDAVREAVVLTTDDATPRLVAYPVLRYPEKPTALRARLAARLPEYMVPARLVVVDSLPTLPNGKVDLRRLRKLRPEPASPVLGPGEGPTTSTEKALLGVWREVLQQQSIGLTDNFFSLGGDSILSIRVVARARAVGLTLPPAAIFERQTIKQLAAVAKTASSAAKRAGNYSGPCALTPIQRWFFSEHRYAPQHWNQGWIMELPIGYTDEKVNRVSQELWRTHDALRLTFSRAAAIEWTARIEPVEPGIGVAYYTQESSPEAQIDAWQRQLILERGPLFHVMVFGGTPRRLVVLAHHLVVDAVSWDWILRAFTAPASPPPTFWREWVAQLVEWGDSGRFLPELPFWESQAATGLTTDHPVALPVTEGAVRSCYRQLSEALTRQLLTVANEAYGTRPEELLLTGLMLALHAETGQQALCINLERHGREPLDGELDPGTTVGWFTASHPLHLTIWPEDTETSVIAVKERMRAVPNKGLGYGVLRYLGERGGALDQQPLVYFNYLGQRRPAENGLKPLRNGLRHPGGERHRIWEINVVATEGRLEVDLAYATQATEAATATRLLEAWDEQLTKLVRHCLSQEERRMTPADFPEAELSQEDLNNLLNDLDLSV